MEENREKKKAKKGRKERRKEGRKEGKKEGRKEGRNKQDQLEDIEAIEDEENSVACRKQKTFGHLSTK